MPACVCERQCETTALQQLPGLTKKLLMSLQKCPLKPDSFRFPAGRQTPAVDDYGEDEFEDEEPVAVPAAVPAKVPAPAAVAVPAPMPAQPPAPSAASVSQPKAGRRLKHVHVGMLKCHEMPSCCHHAAIIAISC